MKPIFSTPFHWFADTSLAAWLGWIVIIIVALILMCGCMPTASELNAIARDHSEVDIDITLPWGSVHLHRKNPWVPATQPAVKP